MSESLKHIFEERQKKLRNVRIAQIGLGLLLGVLIATFILVWQSGKEKQNISEIQRQATQATQQTANIPPPTKNLGGPFMLTNQDSKQITDADFRGSFMLIYFGYTYCPDMCPTGLSSMAHAMDQLGSDADKVQPIFVTIDPARDTPEKMKAYVTSFHPKIIGLTGTPEQTAQIAKEYSVYYAKGEQVDGQDYLMDHSSLIYLMSPQGKFITTFDEEADPKAIVKAVKERITGK